MRSVAPERPGSAASQKSWSVVKVKPTSGSRTTTTLQTIQTAKESSRAGMEIQRLRLATARPSAAQKALSSTSQRSSTREPLIASLRATWGGAAAR